MRTLSLDLRERILASYDLEEGTRVEVGDRYRVSLGMVKKLLQQRQRDRGDRSAPPFLRAQADDPGGPSAPDADSIESEARPDLERAARGLELDCSLPAIHYVLAKMGLTYKKRHSMPASKTVRTLRGRAAPGGVGEAARPAKLIFLDESGAQTNLTRLRGRALRGQPVHAQCPQGHWQTTTMIGAIRLDSPTACMTIEGATDTEVSGVYVWPCLVPDAARRRCRHHGWPLPHEK